MSVALRTITRLQDADDINVSLGVGVDEYALCWDNDTARFVLRTTAGYDHGLLAAGSLGDDDHTQYALLAGRAGGQTLYGGTAANQSITIHGTSDATRTTSYVLLQPTAGRVGIGTTAPGYPVDILNTTEADVYALNLRASSSTARPGLRMEGLRPDAAGMTFDLFKVDIGKVGYAVTQIGKIGAYGFCADSSSGYYMYLSGVSDASWNVNATLKLSSTNRVGINVPGSDMPATALHVVGAATITGGIRPAADSTTALQLQNASGTSVLNVDTTNARVGIGTTSPSYPLHVAGTQDSTNAVAYIINSGTGRGLFIDNVAGTSNFGLYIVTAASTNLASGMVFGGQPSGAGFATFAFYSDGKYALGPGDATRDTVLSRHGVSKFKISSDGVNGAAALYVVGRIGINAENPATALDISAGALTMAEMTAPTGAANKATLYTKDNGSGKTALCCKLGDDVEIVLATQA